MFKLIRKEVNDILALDVNNIYNSDDAQALLGDRYSDFIASNEYKDARKTLDETTHKLRKLFSNWNSSTAYLKINDDFITKYEQYISDYREAIKKYEDALKTFGKNTSKKSSGF